MSKLKPDCILGLSGFLKQAHDANWCLVDAKEQQVVSYCEMEKISGKRHDNNIPIDVLGRELRGIKKLDVVTMYPHYKFRGINSVELFNCHMQQQWDYSYKIFLCGQNNKYKYYHELGHIFSSYMYRQKDDTKFLGQTIEGFGSFSQNSLFLIDGQNIELLEYNRTLLSGDFFNFLAAKVFDIPWGEMNVDGNIILIPKEHRGRAAPGKLMALAAYGDPYKYRDILEDCIKDHADGKLLLSDVFFKRVIALTEQEKIDLCASGQQLFEDLIVEQAIRDKERYGDLPMYYGGGCGLSIKVNSKLKKIFNDLTIAPCCNDGGLSIGFAALHAWKRGIVLNPVTTNTLSFSDSNYNITGSLTDDQIEQVAEWIKRGEVVAFAQGMPEAGPRALGHRSILGNPSIEGMKQLFNDIKQREYYRPVAPMVLDSVGSEIFDDYFYSPFMLYEFQMKDKYKKILPAALHKDGTSRIQSVPDGDSDIARLLRVFARITGLPPVLLNTSLNSKGRAIAGSRDQVIEEIETLGIKYLVIGSELWHGMTTGIRQKG